MCNHQINTFKSTKNALSGQTPAAVIAYQVKLNPLLRNLGYRTGIDTKSLVDMTEHHIKSVVD